MDAYLVWGYIHILLFVFWLGADVGVFLGAIMAKNAKLGFEARMTVLKLAMIVDLFPRICFALMPAVGLHLTNALGLYSFPAWVFIAAWMLAAGWISVIFAIGKYEGTSTAQTLGTAQLVFEGLAGVTITGFGVWSLVAGGPISEPWFALKIALFGCVFFAAIGIDVCFRPFVKPFMEIGQDRSTPEREAAVSASINKTLVAVLTLYALIAVVAFLGKVKPI